MALAVICRETAPLSKIFLTTGYVMLCYVNLCYVMLCYVMLCYVIMNIYLFISMYLIIYLFKTCNMVFQLLPKQNCCG